jgi:hypothetical protein
MPETNGGNLRGEEVLRAAMAADPRRIAEFVQKYGYEIWRISEDGRLQPWQISNMVTDKPLALANAAFARPELRASKPDLFDIR